VLVSYVSPDTGVTFRRAALDGAVPALPLFLGVTLPGPVAATSTALQPLKRLLLGRDLL
jgi:hypothetical protein